MFNIWHDISSDRVSVDEFIAVIEIGAGMKKKYELDKETGMLMLDRILHTSTHYPANYGFIPKTFADDGDPLDVLVICSEDLEPMSLVKCYPIGVMRMKDGGENDDKIIAIPVAEPQWNHVKDIKQLSEHILNEFVHFFKVYKDLEKRKTPTNLEVLDVVQAKSIIKTAIDDYKSHFSNKA